MARLDHGGGHERGGGGYVRGGLSTNSRWKADVSIRAATPTQLSGFGHRHIRLAIRGWTLRDGNVRDGHPAVLGLYPIPIGEKAGGPEAYTAKSIPFCLPREANRKGRISVTRPDGIALYHNSGSVPNPSLTARAAQLVPCEVPPRSL